MYRLHWMSFGVILYTSEKGRKVRHTLIKNEKNKMDI